jgi:arylsulfatase A
VSKDLVDTSDFFATCADLGGAKLPEGVTIDGHSFAPQVRGEAGTPREWVYVELNGNSYARDKQFKLTNQGEMFDLSEAPFKEIPVAADSTDPNIVAARKALQTVLDEHQAAPFKKQAPTKKQRKQRAMRRKLRQAQKAGET